jgi:hypothetical protein
MSNGNGGNGPATRDHFGNGNKPRPVPLARLLERTNREGRKYITGALGPAKVLLINTGEEMDGQPVWQLYFTESFPVERAAALAREVEEQREAR